MIVMKVPDLHLFAYDMGGEDLFVPYPFPLASDPHHLCTHGTNNLSGGGELGREGEGVVDGRVGKVGVQIGQGPVTGDDGLDVEPKHGEHGEATVLDLLHLELGEGVGVVGQAEGVEGLTGVEGVEALTGGPTVHAVTLDGPHEEHLEDGDGDDGLGVDERLGAQVVETTLLEDLGPGLEPDSLAEVGATVLGDELGGDAPEGTEHGPARVDHLGLTVAAEGLGVGGEAGRVPSVVTGELTGEVSGGLGVEGPEDGGPVGTVPVDRAGGNGAGGLGGKGKKKAGGEDETTAATLPRPGRSRVSGSSGGKLESEEANNQLVE